MRRASLVCLLALVAGGCRSRLLAPDGGSIGGGDLGGVGSGGTGDVATSASGAYKQLHAAVACGVNAIASGDFDGDGRADLALACSSNASSGTILVLLGQGDGTFVEFELGPAAPFVDIEHVATGDLDGDGHADILGASQNRFALAEILAVKGVTRTSASQLRGAGMGLALADLDGDGRLDWAVAEEVAAPEMDWALGDGKGGFGATQTLTLHEAQLGRLAAGDFDGDGNIDLAVGTTQPHVTLVKGDGKGGFALLTQVAIPDGPTSADVLAAGDLDGDGLPDLAIAAAGAGLFMLADHGGLAARRLATAPDITAGAIGDSDGNKLEDIVIGTAGGAVELIRQDPQGVFVAPGTIATIPGAAAVAFVDANGDGLNDVIVGSNNAIDVFLRLAP